MPRPSLASLLVTAAVALSLVALGDGPADSATRPAVAPYMELSGPNAGNLPAAIAAGLRKVTAAFVIGKACRGTWDDGTALTNAARTRAISNARKKGVQVAVSFGGASGRDLARTCANGKRLKAAYQAAITRFKADRIDFDIEGAAINPTAQRTQIARRFTAIRALEKKHPRLVVSLTIPSGPSGLEASGVALLRTAKRTATRIDVVNLMAMDYGSPVTNMGTTAIAAAQGALRQIRTVWPRFSYARLGITPMIGQNDSAGEVLTTAQAKTLVSWATSHGIRLLAFWSLNRDQQCAGSPTGAQDSCSGTTQTGRQFTRIFLGRA
jgi:chitinase